MHDMHKQEYGLIYNNTGDVSVADLTLDKMNGGKFEELNKKQ